jgi:hypothetical protein
MGLVLEEERKKGRTMGEERQRRGCNCNYKNKYKISFCFTIC